jgi:hypothetical protein
MIVVNPDPVTVAKKRSEFPSEELVHAPVPLFVMPPIFHPLQARMEERPQYSIRVSLVVLEVVFFCQMKRGKLDALVLYSLQFGDGTRRQLSAPSEPEYIARLQCGTQSRLQPSQRRPHRLR